MSGTLLEVALAYAACDWPVFPCRGKKPWIAKKHGGNGVHDATTDPETIRRWWTDWPRANIGLAAGAPSGWWALDIDPIHSGAASLSALMAEHGSLPETVEQITGSGGRHILFRWNGEAIRNKAGEPHGLPPGIDTRSTGGYIIVAPSIHPDTGRPYRWREDRHPLHHPLAEAPDWLIDLVTVRESDPFVGFVSTARATFADSTAAGARYTEVAVLRELEALRAAPPGSRNQALNKASFCLAQLAAAGALDLGSTARALAAAALAAGLPAREVGKTLASGIAAGLAQPRGLPR